MKEHQLGNWTKLALHQQAKQIDLLLFERQVFWVFGEQDGDNNDTDFLPILAKRNVDDTNV